MKSVRNNELLIDNVTGGQVPPLDLFERTLVEPLDFSFYSWLLLLLRAQGHLIDRKMAFWSVIRMAATNSIGPIMFIEIKTKYSWLPEINEQRAEKMEKKLLVANANVIRVAMTKRFTIYYIVCSERISWRAPSCKNCPGSPTKVALSKIAASKQKRKAHKDTTILGHDTRWSCAKVFSSTISRINTMYVIDLCPYAILISGQCAFDTIERGEKTR